TTTLSSLSSPIQILPPKSSPTNRTRLPRNTTRASDHGISTVIASQKLFQVTHSRCLRPQLVSVVRRSRSAARRTPTPPSVASPPTCSSRMSSARTSVRRTPAFPSGRSARSWVSAGRPSTTSSALRTRPRLLPTKSDTRTRSRLTTLRLTSPPRQPTRVALCGLSWCPLLFPCVFWAGRCCMTAGRDTCFCFFGAGNQWNWVSQQWFMISMAADRAAAGLLLCR
ncbi:hypothetical protein TPAR_00007, partial [Tolypocladium paradoxum]